jgi:CRISPR-associated protein Csm5
MSRYRVTCLSPVLAGDGGELSPIDYMVWRGHVNVLDQRRIFRLLAKGSRLEGYLTQVRKATKLDFGSWGGFAQNFAERRVPFEHASAVAHWERLRSEDCFIPTFARNGSGAYLPASVIRGSLRTVMAAAALKGNADALERAAAAERTLRRPGTEVEREALGSRHGQAGLDVLKAVAAGDSDPISNDPLQIFLTRTASLVEQRGSPGRFGLGWRLIPRGTVEDRRIADSAATFAEMAMPGTTFEGEWTERAHYQSPEIAKSLGWDRGYSREDLLQAANGYAAIALDQHRAFAAVAGLDELQQSVESLLGQLQQAAENGNACLLNLGWGGGMLGKTLWPRMSGEAIRRVLAANPFYERAIRTGIPFPKSRRIVFSNDRPRHLAGWVRLEWK